MTHVDTTRAIPRETTLRLCELLGEEDRQYRRLLRLAWRQNRYLRRQDVARLEHNSGQWQKYLPDAAGARERRERFVTELMRTLDVSEDRFTPQFLVDRADHESGKMLREIVAGLARTTDDLNRQTELNRRLGAFCLELSREEAEIFRRAVTEDPAGCYDDEAGRTTAPPGGIFIRQA